jgi:hypothetical protein
MASLRLVATVLDDNGELLTEAEVENDLRIVRGVPFLDNIDIEELCETLVNELRTDNFYDEV